MADLSPGVPNALRPLVRRIVSPTGTNTYLVGIDEIAVIDPGSADPDHVDAILGCGGDRIRWVLVTSTARGHAEGAAAVAARTGAEVLGFGAGDGFEPHVVIGDGYELEATEFRLLALHTPGMAADHLCYLLEDDRILISGDLVRGRSAATWPPPSTSTPPAGWRRSSACRSYVRPCGASPPATATSSTTPKPPWPSSYALRRSSELPGVQLCRYIRHNCTPVGQALERKTDQPPGPTAAAATSRTMPKMICPWRSWTMPTMARMTAMTHKTVALMAGVCPPPGL